MSNIIPLQDIERMAHSVAKSGLFGVKQPDQALALMLIAQAEGLHPAIAARDYHVISGRPALKADAMLARFQTAGGSVRWKSMTEQCVAAEFSHPQGGKVEIDWTIDMAKRAGLNNGDNWKKYPRAMLRARCISEGVRTVFPGVVVGTYTPEEVEDMPPEPQEPRDITPQPSAAWLDEHLRYIASADNLTDLKAEYDAAIKAARKAGDNSAREKIIAVKDARKAQLTAQEPTHEAGATIDGETGEVI